MPGLEKQKWPVKQKKRLEYTFSCALEVSTPSGLTVGLPVGSSFGSALCLRPCNNREGTMLQEQQQHVDISYTLAFTS